MKSAFFFILYTEKMLTDKEKMLTDKVEIEDGREV